MNNLAIKNVQKYADRKKKRPAGQTRWYKVVWRKGQPARLKSDDRIQRYHGAFGGKKKTNIMPITPEAIRQAPSRIVIKGMVRSAEEAQIRSDLMQKKKSPARHPLVAKIDRQQRKYKLGKYA